MKKLVTASGVECDVLNIIRVDDKLYFFVDPGVAKYVGGVLTRYMLCPITQFKVDIECVERELDIKEEVIDNDIANKDEEKLDDNGTKSTEGSTPV